MPATLALPTALELARALFKRVAHRRWPEASEDEKELFLQAGEAAAKVFERAGGTDAGR